MTIILMALAIIMNIVAVVTLIVTYRTDRDTWKKIQDIENRLKKLERQDENWFIDPTINTKGGYVEYIERGRPKGRRNN